MVRSSGADPTEQSRSAGIFRITNSINSLSGARRVGVALGYDNYSTVDIYANSWFYMLGAQIVFSLKKNAQIGIFIETEDAACWKTEQRS